MFVLQGEFAVLSPVGIWQIAIYGWIYFGIQSRLSNRETFNKMKCNLLDTNWAMEFFFSFIEVEKNAMETGKNSFKKWNWKKEKKIIYGSGKNAMETGGKTFEKVKTETAPQKSKQHHSSLSSQYMSKAKRCTGETPQTKQAMSKSFQRQAYHVQRLEYTKNYCIKIGMNVLFRKDHILGLGLHLLP